MYLKQKQTAFQPPPPGFPLGITVGSVSNMATANGLATAKSKKKKKKFDPETQISVLRRGRVKRSQKQSTTGGLTIDN